MAEPTIEEREGYLRGLSEGQPRPVAARMVNKAQTGTAFRRLIARDPAFAQEVDVAEAEGKQELIDLTRAAIQRRALNIEERTTRALELLAATLLPEYAWLKMKGSGGRIEASRENLLEALSALLHVKFELLTDGQIDTLLLIYEYGRGERPNPELQAEMERRQIEASSHPVIDA